MSAALDQAIAKLDAILAAVGEPAAAAAAAPGPAAAAAPARAAAAAAAAGAAAAAAGGCSDCWAKAQIKVARITSAEPLANSAKLLKLQADLGGGDLRQIVAGLAQYVQPPQLVGNLVCVAANLKPAKLAGEKSEAMVLAAEASSSDGKLLVRTLQPPEGSLPGEVVHCDGASPPASFPKTIKSAEWAKVLPGLVVAGGKATFNGTPLVTSQGLVTLPAEIADGAEIH